MSNFTDDPYFELEKELREQTRQQKIIGHSALKKRSGRGTRKVMLPSDYLTAKEKKGLSGDVMTYNLSKPMRWAEFKFMPHDLQKQYLEKLRDEHCASQIGVTKMLGISEQSFINYCKPRGLSVFRGGTRKSAEAIAKWEAFLRGDEQTEPDPEVQHQAAPPGFPFERPKPLNTMKCTTDFTMRFSGEFDLWSFVEMVAKHISDGENVYINLHVTVNPKEEQGD